jgi:hypothetical protein
MLRTSLAAASTVLAAVSVLAPATGATAADEGWHPVNEQWQPYPEDELFLPAGRYCDGFDVRSVPVFQDVRYRVVTRWDSGGARDTEYTGPLLVEATNTSTGETVRLDLSGRAETLQRPDGSLAVYETNGPVGFGWPTGSVGLPQGFYVFRGRHVVEFPVGAPRELVVDQGTETDVCAMLD